jgi:hypothetical protein
LSTGTDGFLKIWDTHQTLLREVDLGPSLGAAIFNEDGNILLSFQHQLYCMKSTKFYPLSAALCEQRELDESLNTSDSAVFEDPSLKYDVINDDQLTTDIESYLVPYSLPMKKAWLLDDGLENPCKSTSDEETNDSDEDSDVLSMTSSQAAPSEAYQSSESTLLSHLTSLTDLRGLGMVEYNYDCQIGDKYSSWPLVELSPVSSPPQSPTQYQSILEISAEDDDQANSYMKEGQSQPEEVKFHSTISHRLEVMKQEKALAAAVQSEPQKSKPNISLKPLSGAPSGVTLSSNGRVSDSTNCSNWMQLFEAEKINVSHASAKILSNPTTDSNAVIHQYTSSSVGHYTSAMIAKMADTVQKDTGSTRSTKNQRKRGRKSKIAHMKHCLSKDCQKDNSVADVARVHLFQDNIMQTDQRCQYSTDLKGAEANSILKTSSGLTSISLQQAVRQISLCLHEQEPLNSWDDVSQDVDQGSGMKQKSTSDTFHSERSTNDVYKHSTPCLDTSMLLDGEQFRPISVAGSDRSCDTSFCDMSSVFSSQGALVCLGMLHFFINQ